MSFLDALHYSDSVLLARTLPLLKWRGVGEVNFNYLTWRGESEKLKKRGGSMVQGQVLLKGGEELALFLFSFFRV